MDGLPKMRLISRYYVYPQKIFFSTSLSKFIKKAPILTPPQQRLSEDNREEEGLSHASARLQSQIRADAPPGVNALNLGLSG